MYIPNQLWPQIRSSTPSINQEKTLAAMADRELVQAMISRARPPGLRVNGIARTLKVKA